jgi:hypothetical protein
LSETSSSITPALLFGETRTSSPGREYLMAFDSKCSRARRSNFLSTETGRGVRSEMPMRRTSRFRAAPDSEATAAATTSFTSIISRLSSSVPDSNRFTCRMSSRISFSSSPALTARLTSSRHRSSMVDSAMDSRTPVIPLRGLRRSWISARET